MLTEKELGERLKNVRKMRNISQFRMADMMGTEQSFIAKLEKGASYPKVSTLYRYAECVGFTLSDILAESPPAKKGMLSPEEIGGGKFDPADGLWKPSEKGLGYGRVLDYIGVRY